MCKLIQVTSYRVTNDVTIMKFESHMINFIPSYWFVCFKDVRFYLPALVVGLKPANKLSVQFSKHKVSKAKECNVITCVFNFHVYSILTLFCLCL